MRRHGGDEDDYDDDDDDYGDDGDDDDGKSEKWWDDVISSWMATFVSMEEQAAVSEVKRCGGSFCFKTKGDRDLTDDDLLLKNLKSLWQVIVFKPTDLHLTSTPACQKLFTVYASAFSQLLCVESLKKLYLTYLFIWSYGFFCSICSK